MILRLGRACASKVTALEEAGHRFGEKWSKARTLVRLHDLRPKFIRSFYIAPSATVAGEVYIGHKNAIMGNAVLRGDINSIMTEQHVYIGEGCVLHTCASLPNGLVAELHIDGWSVIESGCTLYSCTIGKFCLVGENSVVMEGAVLEDGAVLAPGSVVPPGRVVPAGQMWGGNPIRFLRYCEHKHPKTVQKLAIQYTSIGLHLDREYLPYCNAFLQKENETPSEADAKALLGYTSADRPSPYFHKYFC
jgi:carbonic anhydrase/acetyltransferase-like protein (isoleucine patch superfamily)